MSFVPVTQKYTCMYLTHLLVLALLHELKVVRATLLGGLIFLS